MAWTRIDDKFLLNPKIQTVGVHGMALYLSGLIYCNSNLTDGFILEGVLPMLCGMAYQTPAKKTADLLVEVNLWEKVEGGYQVHDFLKFNKSKQEIESINKAKAINGAKGGRPAKQTETYTETYSVSKPVSKQPPIIPNPLSLIPNDKNLKDPPPPDARDEISEIVQTYEQEIGKMTQVVIDDILSVIDEYPLEWFVEAFKESARNNKRSWAYAKAILKRWKADGYKVDTRIKQGNNVGRKSTKSTSSDLDEILDGAPIFAEDKK